MTNEELLRINHCDERIKERYNGESEGRTDATALVDFSDPNDTRYEIEPLPLFRKRIREFWGEILRRSAAI